MGTRSSHVIRVIRIGNVVDGSWVINIMIVISTKAIRVIRIDSAILGFRVVIIDGVIRVIRVIRNGSVVITNKVMLG